MTRVVITSLFALSISLAAAASHSADNSGHDHGGALATRDMSPPAATNRPVQNVSRTIRSSQKAWTSAPLLLPYGRGDRASTGRGDRASTEFSATNLATEHLEIFSPDTPKVSREVQLENGTWRVSLNKPTQGGFHWLKATEKTEGEVRTATTFWYSPNHSSSPAAMLDNPSMGLEIVPQPIPDHDAYYEGKTWQFLVRYGGKPVADAELILETEFGSKLRTLADPNGVARVVFPRDFEPKLWEGKPLARIRGNFVISVSREIDGLKHLSALNYNYAPDPLRERSLMAGAGFTLLGMLLAAPLLRRNGRTQAVKEQT